MRVRIVEVQGKNPLAPFAKGGALGQTATKYQLKVTVSKKEKAPFSGGPPDKLTTNH